MKDISFPIFLHKSTQVTMNLTFQEAARGVNKDLELSVIEDCFRCGGSGAEPGSAPSKCPQCNGTGMVRTLLPSSNFCLHF